MCVSFARNEVSKMVSEGKNGKILEDKRVNVRIVLAALWAAHFLLWTFGDMMALLQQRHEPVDSDIILGRST
jgi:hypothetical protein